MGKPIRDLVARVAAPLGWFASARTPYSSVRGILPLLRPFDPGRPLVRVGGNGDGGYLVPDDLEEIVACFSPGVGSQAEFERDLSRRGLRCFLADRSVEGPPPGCEGMSFERKFLGTFDSDDFTTLSSWVARHPEASEGDLLLQMDIEGGEYGVIASLEPALLRRFRILVIEFHHLEWLTQPLVHATMRDAFAKLASEFAVVHLHPNNQAGIARLGPVPVPRLLEATYLRRDRCLRLEPRHDFPHPEDRDNVPRKPAVALPREWYA